MKTDIINVVNAEANYQKDKMDLTYTGLVNNKIADVFKEVDSSFSKKLDEALARVEESRK